MSGEGVVRVPAEVAYNPRAATLYIQLKKSSSKAVNKLPGGNEPDIILILTIHDIYDGLAGIEILLNPKSKLKQTLDNELTKLTKKEAQKK